MEYTSEEIRQFLKMYREIYTLGLDGNATNLYISKSMEELQAKLNMINGFPDDFYSEGDVLEGDVKKCISLLEKAIGYHKKDLEAAKLNSNKDNMLKH
jgi:hypothetical protein